MANHRNAISILALMRMFGISGGAASEPAPAVTSRLPGKLARHGAGKGISCARAAELARRASGKRPSGSTKRINGGLKAKRRAARS